MLKEKIGIVSVVFNSETTSFFGQQDVKRKDVIDFLERNGFALRVDKKTRIAEGEPSNTRKTLKRYDGPNKGKTETLAERLARQRKEKEQKEAENKQAAGLLSGISSWIW